MVAGVQQVACAGHEVGGGSRESFGQDPARLRRYQAVVFAVPDLDGYPDLAERHAPGPGFERVVQRQAASSLPERLGRVPGERLPEVLAGQDLLVGRPELRGGREQRRRVAPDIAGELGKQRAQKPGARLAATYTSRSSLFAVALAPGRSNGQVDDTSAARVMRSGSCQAHAHAYLAPPETPMTANCPSPRASAKSRTMPG